MSDLFSRVTRYMSKNKDISTVMIENKTKKQSIYIKIERGNDKKEQTYAVGFQADSEVEEGEEDEEE